MGQDKSLLPFRGFSTLVEYQYQKLQKIFSKVYICTKKDKFNFHADLIIDENKKDYSPMIALSSIFSKLQDKKVFIIGVDIPFVSQDTIEFLIKNSDNNLVTIASDYQYTHNLIGVYNRKVYPYILNMLNEDNHKINTLINMLESSSIIEFKDPLEFTNINTCEQFNNALEISKYYR